MKKLLVILLASVILLTLIGCVPSETASNGKIVCTVFAEYDFVRTILGENPAKIDVVYLLANGADIHSFQNSFTAKNKLDCMRCDLFAYVGGPSEEWIETVLSDPSSNKNRQTVCLFDLCEKKTEEMTEGMKEEEGEEEKEYDEHLWLSLKNAKICVNALCDAICRIDGENEAVYRRNAAAYLDRLDALDADYQAAAASASVGAVVFADRFPFRYLLDDYGIRYFAAFPGCSTETNTTYENLVVLADKMKEYDVPALLVTEHSSVHISDTLMDLSERQVDVLTLNSLQSVTSKEAETLTYYDAMKNNLNQLKGALAG